MSGNFVVGVTGGIGAGKTAVTDIFQLLGIDVVDADQVARDIVRPNEPALNQIVETFGSEILLADGNLDRAKLREIIFSDTNKKAQLNDIMFPAIRIEMLEQLTNSRSPYVILSAPLLLENKLQQYTDRVLVVDVPISIQIERACARDDVNKQQIEAIISSQIDREKRLQLADDVIDNSQPLEYLSEKVTKLHKKYLCMV